MLIDQLCEEIRFKLRLHRCKHKACDCYRARELLATLGALDTVKYPWYLEILTTCTTRDVNDEL